MRKTSQDGGDNTSITSGVENEIKKPIVGIMKTKRNSIKRKVQNFSHESDDAVIEPLLQKDKTDIPTQSAKHMLPKTKTASSGEKGDDRDKLLSDERVEKPSLSNAPSAIGSSSTMNGTKEIINHKSKLSEGSSTIHNHMNTNIFGSFEGGKNISTPKSQILVEIDSSKSTGYSPSPLIFTTAKIHTDGNKKHMEPVQVTPVPILSTVEGSVKIGVGCTDKIVSGVTVKGSNIINPINANSNHTELKTARDPQNTKTSVTVSSPSCSEIPCTSPRDTLSGGKSGADLNKCNPSNNALPNNNSSIKPVISVDIKVPTKTIKPDLNTVGSNSSTKYAFDTKDVFLKKNETQDVFKTCENIVDVNKIIEANKRLIPHGTSSDNSVSSTSSSMPKSAIELDKNKDSCKIDSKVKNIEVLQESNASKTSDNKNKPKEINILQSTTSKLTSENVTSLKQTIAATTSIKTQSTGATATPKSVTTTSTSLASKPASTSIMSAKPMVTNVISTDKSTVKELSSSKPIVITEASNILKKSDISVTKMPISTTSSKVKSTVSTIISTPNISITKSVPTTSSSVKNVTSVIKTSSTQLPVNTTSMTIAVTTNTNTEKPVDSSVNTKLNNLTKTILTVDSNKTIALTNDVPNSTTTIVPTVKASVKSTTSVLKPSTSVTTSKPASTVVTSNSIKQPSTKLTLAKSNTSGISSVKTLITSSDKPSSTRGSDKNSSIKSSNKQTESKCADSKKA